MRSYRLRNPGDGSGQKTFCLVTRYPGATNPTRRALGEYGALTLEKATGNARAWLELIQRGEDPALAEDRARLEAVRMQENSFAAAAEEFIKRHVSRTRKAKEVEREISKELITRWGPKPIIDITRRDVVDMTEELVDRGAPYQAHNVLGHVRTLFNWAIGRGHLWSRNVAVRPPAPGDVIGKKAVRTRVLTDDEMRAFWRATAKTDYPYGPLLRLPLLTGQRKSEVAEAAWSEFDVTKALWIIPAERMKMDAPHVVALSDEVLEILADLPRFEAGDMLFSTTFGEKAVSGFSKAKRRVDALMLTELRSIAEAAGQDTAKIKLAERRIHDLWRTMRTHLSALPVADTVRELVIAHAKPGLHKIYDQFSYLDERQRALELWAVRLMAIVGKAGGPVMFLNATVRLGGLRHACAE